MRSRPKPIACQGLTKRFGGRTAVHDLSFEVAEGTITGFVGANGAGKTTTMRMLLGLVAPSSGTALIAGRPYRQLERPRRCVGVVLDGTGAHPAHTARVHLRAIAAAADIADTRVDEVLQLVELDAHAGRRVGGFSLGMQQRLALAAALLGDPPVLVLDEPTNGLDPPGIVWMRDLLRSLADEGRAVLVSSHLLTELAAVADRVVIIDRGRLVTDATLAELLARTSPVVEVACANPEVLSAALWDAGAAVTAEGDLLVVEGSSARAVGELAARIGADPLSHLRERTSSFEEAYFELAGTLGAASAAHERSAR